MNQLCKHLIVKNSFTKSLHIFNKLNYSKTTKYISLLNQNYPIKPINSDFQQIKINTTIRLYVSSSKPYSGLKPQLRKNTHTSIDADFKDAIPVESTGESDYGSATSDFSKFDLPVELLDRLKQKGYIKPYEIQDSTLKHTLNGRDLVGKAFTGSGKTLAFAIPIIARIMKSEKKSSRYPKCLVLAPTRELCLQLQKTIQELAPNLICIPILGGTGYEKQINQLNRKVDIVCATPGRLNDLIQRKNFVTEDIEIICLDEADLLLRKDFIEQIQDVIELSNKKQMMMFSATINREVMDLINKYMHKPVLVDLTEGQKYKLPTNIDHYMVKASFNSNFNLIKNYIDEFKSKRCIVFANTKKLVTMTSNILNMKGTKVDHLHSDISQFKREKILESFRRGYLNVLVATDVASRGIDIPEVDLVIQVGVPQQGLDFYIHRSGRTGRGGRPGTAIMISNENSENETIRDLSRIIKFKKLEPPAGLNENHSDFERRPHSFKKSRYDENNRDKPFRKNYNNLRESISDFEFDSEKPKSFRKNRYDDDFDNDFENNQYNRDNFSNRENSYNKNYNRNRFTSKNEDFHYKSRNDRMRDITD